MDTNSLTRRTVLGAIGGGVVSSGAVGTVSAEDDAVVMTFRDQQVRGVGNRHGRQRVLVDHVYVPEPGGWIDLHHSTKNDEHETEYRGGDGNTYDAGLGRPFGISDFLEGGEDHYDVEVPLFVDEGIPCLDFEQDRMEENHYLMAMGHQDSGRMPDDDGNEPEYIHFCWMQADDDEREEFGGGDLSFSGDDERDEAFIEVPPDGRGKRRGER